MEYPILFSPEIKNWRPILRQWEFIFQENDNSNGEELHEELSNISINLTEK